MADEWLRAEELGHCRDCPEKVEYDADPPRRRAARRDPSCGPAGISVGAVGRGDSDLTREALGGKALALVRRLILYRWPEQGWVQGRVVRVSRAVGFSESHGSRCARGSAELGRARAGAGEAAAASLLNSLSHGRRPTGHGLTVTVGG